MKRFKILFLAIVTMFCGALAVNAEGEALTSVKMYFEKCSVPTLTEGEMVISLYEEDGNTLLDTKTYALKRDGNAFDVEFSVPEFSAGKKFRAVFSGTVESINHNGVSAKEHTLETYAMPDENGILQHYTSFYMSVNPLWNKEAVIKLPGVKQTLFYHCLYKNEVYVSNDLLTLLGIKYEQVEEEGKKGILLSTGDYKAKFFVGENKCVIGENEVFLDIAPFEMGDLVFVPLSKVAIYFACNYNFVNEDIYHREISLTPSYYSEVYKAAEYINSIDIDSRTDYLIWVSKKDYTVTLFTGSNGKWRFVNSYPCAIGAPKSPTIEGRFEYYQYQDRWQYNGYYCGPVMRFKGGYALHSVLIRNNGTFYDGRVKAKISHGCVRMLPDDIKWMVDFVPLYTRIFVTA